MNLRTLTTLCSIILFIAVTLNTSRLLHAKTENDPNKERVWNKKWSKKFDRHFRKQGKHYFGPNFDWRWFKAQAIAESSLRQNIKSRTGAIGLMQIQPRTFAEIKQKNPHFIDITSPRWNIAAGIYYDRQLYKRWKNKDVPPQDRFNFSLAAFNAGFVGVLRAIKRIPNKVQANTLNKVSWSTVAPYVPRETKGYVWKINKLMGR